jgi:regulation of enolase protein 1 (concanavalin A-like superfamily)
MDEFQLGSVPAPLRWQNSPVEWSVKGEDGLAILSAARTDLFIDPEAGTARASAPVAVFAPLDEAFILSARVEVHFVSTYDAAVLQMLVREDLWAKLCFEYSPQKEPMIVSVVTRGVSDDCNAAALQSSSVYLRIAQAARSTAFHFSADGRTWRLVRYFALGSSEGLRVGFSSQSPTGAGCSASFAEIRYVRGKLADIRGGQ